MSINIHFMKASGRLASFKDEIVSEAKGAANKVKGILVLPDVDIIICDNPDRAIPEIGVGGETMTPNLILVYIDPLFSNLERSIRKEIKSTIAHELLHSARENALGPTKTLLEAVMSEGLADNFDIEITDTKPHTWDIALDKKALAVLRERAQKEFNNKEYNHNEWFFGSEEKKIPKWTGYSIGFNLASNYISKTKKKASDLYKLDAKEFIK